MASMTLQFATQVALCCMLVSVSSSFALPMNRRQIGIPWENPPSDNEPATVQPTTTQESTLEGFTGIHINNNNNNDNTAPVGGFHLKLYQDISIPAATGSTLNYFSVDQGSNQELFLEEESGFNNIKGEFRPSNGLYHLSTLVHLSSMPVEAAATAASPPAAAAEESEKPPRVTVTFCINDNCGTPSILKSSSTLPSSGDLQTVSVSGILQLKRGQKVTVKVDNHSTERQVVVSEQSTMSAYLLKAN